MRIFRWALLVLMSAACPAKAAEVTVFAAASLKTALDAAAADYSEETGVEIRAVYAGSSVLARQIRFGAPADVVILANTAWMDDLEAGNLIEPDTRRDLLGNRLVLVAPSPAKDRGEIGPDADIAELLGSDGRLAIALTEAVPAGIYGKAALVALGQWEVLRPRLAETDNVRAALALVATGATPLGVVYATDATADPRVTRIGTFPKTSHPNITYPAALVTGASDSARAVLEYLTTAEGLAPFAAEGFLIPRHE